MPQTEHSESGPKPLDEVLTDAAIRAKVARVVELPSERKDTLWRSLSSNGLVNLVVGFLLTGLLGSWLTARYQSAADAHRRAAELREIHRSERLSTLDTIGAVLNEGYYAYGRYYDAKVQPQPAESSTARRIAFDQFNERLEKREIVDAARLCAHFGVNANSRYVVIVKNLHHINAQLRAFAGDSAKRQELASTLYQLRDDLFALTTYLAVFSNDSVPQSVASRCDVPPPPPSVGSARMR